MSKVNKIKKNHSYQPYPNETQDDLLWMNDAGSIMNDPVLSGLGSNITTRNEWDDWNIEIDDSNLQFMINDMDFTMPEVENIKQDMTTEVKQPTPPPPSAAEYQMMSMFGMGMMPGGVPIAQTPSTTPPMMGFQPPGMMIPNQPMITYPYGVYPFNPMAFGTMPPQPVTRVAAANSHVTIAKKQGEVKINPTLEAMLKEEEERRKSKLEKSRDMAREARRKKLNYVESLEVSVSRLQISRGKLNRHQWGTSSKDGEAVFGTIEEEKMAKEVKDHVAIGRIKSMLLLHPLERENRTGSSFKSIGQMLDVLQDTLKHSWILYTVVKSANTSDKAKDLVQHLDLTADQVNQIENMRETLIEESRKMAIVIKCFRVLRLRGKDFNSLSPCLDALLGRVLTFDQFNSFIRWIYKVC